MQTLANRPPPRWFLVVAVAAVLWNLVGVAAYLMDVTLSTEALAAMPEAQRALYESQPAWVTGAYAIAVFAGVIGSMMLVLRKRVATAVLGLSLTAVIVQMFYVFAIADTLAVLGAASAALPSVIILIGAALVWLALHAARHHWLT